MAKREFLVIVAFATLVSSIETDDIEHKKRGAGKTTGVNTIPTGIQKPEYTYSIYSQTPNTQSSSASQSYHAQLPNSFYPNQASSQYYNPSSSTNDGSVAHSNPSQVNVASQQSSSQFVPLNFVPNPGYQAKYQIVPSKSTSGNIQLALLQASPGYSASNLHLPQTLYPQSTNQINAHTNPLLNSISPHTHYNFPTNYQGLALGSSYLGHQPTILLPQFNHPYYNNFIYSTPGQNLYYPNSQPKYNYPQSPQTSTSNEYEKIQGSTSQSSSKEDNDIASQSSELIHTDSIPSYKSVYTSGRSSTYTKLK